MSKRDSEMDLSPYTRYPCFDLRHDFAKQLRIRNEELLALEKQPNSVLDRGEVRFQKVEVEYTSRFQLAAVVPEKPAIVIPTRNNLPLLAFTLQNLVEQRVMDHANVLVVDDRSSRESEVVSLCKEGGVSYIRVDNKKGFNFSMLNNIAAHCAHQHGVGELVLWNNDLWVPDSRIFPDLLQAHRQDGNTITGTRLLYPPRGFTGGAGLSEESEEGPASHEGTVQFGGSVFLRQTIAPGHQAFVPHHACRFAPADDHRVKSDRAELFITGAFCVIDMKWFMDAGGLNISLARTLQDVDLCLRANEQDRRVMYLGGDHHLYHGEGTTLGAEGLEGRQFASDALLYTKLWKDERLLPVIIGAEATTQ